MLPPMLREASASALPTSRDLLRFGLSSRLRHHAPRRWFRTCGLIAGFLALNSTLHAAVNKSVVEYGANGGDSIDDTAAIQAAINSGNYIHFPNGVYLISGNLIANASTSTRLYAQNHHGATIRRIGTGLRTLQLYKFDWVARLVFDGVNVSVMGDGAQNTRSIGYNKFINIHQDGTSKNAVALISWSTKTVANVSVYSNNFTGAFAAVVGGCATSTIIDNVMSNCEYGVDLMADSTTIRNNHTTNGKVGIILRAKAQAGPMLAQNLIENNQVTNPREEGISFDSLGDQSASYSRWTSTVYAYDVPAGQATALYLDTYPADPAGTPAGTGTQALVGGYAVFLTDGKPAKGLACRITSATWSSYHGRYKLAIANGPSYAECEQGLRIVVLARLCEGNIIRNNIVKGAGTTGIMLWGAGYGTEITGNRVENCRVGGIQIRHIVRANAVPGKHCPVFYNAVTNNTLISSGSTLPTQLSFTPADYHGVGGTYKAIGNYHIGNTYNGALVSLSNGLEWISQE